MKLLDYIRKGDYSELNDVLLGRKRGRRIFSALEELTAMVRRYESEEPAVEKFINEFDCCEVVDDSYSLAANFDGNPRTSEGKVWLKSVADRYGEVMDERSYDMLSSAIRIVHENIPMYHNPKPYLHNYNRAVAEDIVAYALETRNVEGLFFIKTSSQWAFTEEDIQKIKGFLLRDGWLKDAVFHNIVDDSMGEGMVLDAYFCVVDYEINITADGWQMEKVISDLFDSEPTVNIIDESDFERVFERNNLWLMAELVTQNGVDGMSQLIGVKEFVRNFPMNSSSVTLCIDFSKEEDATIGNVSGKILSAFEKQMPGVSLIWGFRIDPTLPKNGCRVVALTDVPEDYFNPMQYLDQV